MEPPAFTGRTLLSQGFAPFYSFAPLPRRPVSVALTLRISVP